MTAKAQKPKKIKWSKIWPNVLIWLITIVIVLPFLWMIVLSFKDKSEILSNPIALPQSLNFDNYIRVFQTIDLPLMYKNTIIIAVITMVIELVITFLSSYAIIRIPFKNKKIKHFLIFIFMLGLGIPAFILLFPVYRINISLKLMNTYWSLIFPYIATSIAFNTLLFTGFLNDFPTEIEEAAIIDGCSIGRLISQVVVPIVKPVIITVFIFNVLYVWNEFPFAVTMISKPEMYTIPLGVSAFKSMFQVDYGGIVCMVIMTVIPQLIFYGIFQRYIIEGMTAGAVKG